VPAGLDVIRAACIYVLLDHIYTYGTTIVRKQLNTAPYNVSHEFCTFIKKRKKIMSSSPSPSLPLSPSLPVKQPPLLPLSPSRPLALSPLSPLSPLSLLFSSPLFLSSFPLLFPLSPSCLPLLSPSLSPPSLPLSSPLLSFPFLPLFPSSFPFFPFLLAS